MSERTIEQVRKLKSEVKRLKKKIEMYEAREQRLKDYISELVDENKKRKPRKVEVVEKNKNPYEHMLDAILGNFARVMNIFEDEGKNDLR